MSDLHRSDRSKNDDFIKNKYLYVLDYYFNRNYTYIELGDGDEMCENYKYENIIKSNIEVFRKKLNDWSKKNNIIIITGRTYRAVYPKIGNSLYFNDGSSIFQDGITCIEINDGKLVLVKWIYKLNNKKVLSIQKTLLSNFNKIEDFCKVKNI